MKLILQSPNGVWYLVDTIVCVFLHNVNTITCVADYTVQKWSPWKMEPCVWAMLSRSIDAIERKSKENDVNIFG